VAPRTTVVPLQQNIGQRKKELHELYFSTLVTFNFYINDHTVYKYER